MESINILGWAFAVSLWVINALVLYIYLLKKEPECDFQPQVFTAYASCYGAPVCTVEQTGKL